MLSARNTLPRSTELLPEQGPRQRASAYGTLATYWAPQQRLCLRPEPTGTGRCDPASVASPSHHPPPIARGAASRTRPCPPRTPGSAQGPRPTGRRPPLLNSASSSTCSTRRVHAPNVVNGHTAPRLLAWFASSSAPRPASGTHGHEPGARPRFPRPPSCACGPPPPPARFGGARPGPPGVREEG